jgi:hypothetical protein
MYPNIFSSWRLLPLGLLMWISNCILHLVIRPRLECGQTVEIGNFSDYRSSTYLTYETSYVMRIRASLKDVITCAVFFLLFWSFKAVQIYTDGSMWLPLLFVSDMTLCGLFAYIVCLSVCSVPVYLWILSEWRRLQDAVTWTDLRVLAFIFFRRPLTVMNNFMSLTLARSIYFVVSFSYNYFIRLSSHRFSVAFIYSSNSLILFRCFSFICASSLILLDPVYLKQVITQKTSPSFCLLLMKFSVVHEVGPSTCVGVSVSHISRNCFLPLFWFSYNYRFRFLLQRGRCGPVATIFWACRHFKSRSSDCALF